MFGIGWQVQPSWFGEKMKSGTPAQSQAMFGAFMQMVKVDMVKVIVAFDSA